MLPRRRDDTRDVRLVIDEQMALHQRLVLRHDHVPAQAWDVARHPVELVRCTRRVRELRRGTDEHLTPGIEERLHTSLRASCDRERSEETRRVNRVNDLLCDFRGETILNIPRGVPGRPDEKRRVETQIREDLGYRGVKVGERAVLV